MLAALPLSASPAAGGVSAPDPITCAADQVTVVVDFNELGGKTRVACVSEGGTAARVFEEAGFPLVTTDAPTIPGFVCRVGGLPVDGPCGQGSAYWSLWWSSAAHGSTPTEWTYATLGVLHLEVEPGDHLGFAWHEGRGSAAPPDVALPGEPSGSAPGEDEVTSSAVTPEAADEAAGPATWLLVAGAVVVLGAAAAVPLRRRGRS